MTTTDHNDLVPAQEKLEWVTPKISQLVAGDTEGGNKSKQGNEACIGFMQNGVTVIWCYGPS